MQIARNVLAARIPVPLAVLVVFFFTVIRVSVEITLLDYSSYTSVLGFFGNYARFYLENIYYFLTLFLLLAFFVTLLTKKPLWKVARLGVYLSPFVILPPVIDHFLFGRTANYTYGTVDHFIENILTLSWTSGDTGAGISILVTFVAAAIAFFIWHATRSAAATIASVFGTSLIIMTLSTPDLFFGKDRGDYGYDYFLPFYYFVPLIVLAGALYRHYAPEQFKALMGNLRLGRATTFAAAAVLGSLIVPSPDQAGAVFLGMSYRVLFPVASVVFGWWFAVIVNDIFDLKIDAVSYPTRPLPRHALSVQRYAFIGIACAFFSFSFAAAAQGAVALGSLLFLALGFVYSAPPIRLRKTLFGNVVLGAAMVVAFFMGVFTMWQWDPVILLFDKNIFFALLLFAFTFATTLAKDAIDVAGNKKGGVKNLYTLFSRKTAKRIVVALSAIAFNAPPVFMGNPLLIAVTLPATALAAKHYNSRESAPFLYAVGSFILIVFFIYLYYGS